MPAVSGRGGRGVVGDGAHEVNQKPMATGAERTPGSERKSPMAPERAVGLYEARAGLLEGDCRQGTARAARIGPLPRHDALEPGGGPNTASRDRTAAGWPMAEKLKHMRWKLLRWGNRIREWFAHTRWPCIVRAEGGMRRSSLLGRACCFGVRRGDQHHHRTRSGAIRLAGNHRRGRPILDVVGGFE